MLNFATSMSQGLSMLVLVCFLTFIQNLKHKILVQSAIIGYYLVYSELFREFK